jgi:hypothetical protein
VSENELLHYGVLGMKWGIRRYENKDGTLTPAGKKHYEKTGDKGYKYHSMWTNSYKRAIARKNKSAESYRVSSKQASSEGKEKKAAKYDKKAAKAEDKAKKYEEYRKRSQDLDDAEEEYARNVGVGKTLLARLFVDGEVSKAAQMNLAVKARSTKTSVLTKQNKIRARGRTFIEGMILNPQIAAYIRRDRYVRQKGKYKNT